MKPKKAPEWGVCSNCGMSFPERQHYPLSAHVVACWGNDGRTPHPLNPALAPEELAHRRRAIAAKRAKDKVA